MSLLNDWVARGGAVIAADQAMWAKVWDVSGDFAVNLTVAGLILTATIFLSRWASRGVKRLFGRIRVTRRDETLVDFFSQAARWIVLIIGLIAVLQRLGVQTASIIAVLGAATLAIGLALRGTLSDLAAGVMLLILRPYRIGDNLVSQGESGTVRRLDLFNTEIATADNLKVVIPNAKALGDVLTNRTAYSHRRVDLDFDIHYETNIDAAFGIMRGAAAAESLVVEDPPIWTGLTALKDSAMTVTLHAWVLAADWWQARANLMKAVKEAFDREGVVIPYPHQVTVLDPAEAAHPGLPELAGGREEPSVGH